MIVRSRLGKKAQSTAEYAILFALVVGAVVAMQVYTKRGIQGRIKDVVDHTGQAQDVGGQNLSLSGDQYEPYYLVSTSNMTQNVTGSENLAEGGSVARGSGTNSISIRTQNILNVNGGVGTGGTGTGTGGTGTGGNTGTGGGN